MTDRPPVSADIGEAVEADIGEAVEALVPADADGPLAMLVQPIVDIATGQIVAVEALAASVSVDGPSITAVFDAARAAGRGFALEAACIRAARRLRATIDPAVLITINVSPDALEDEQVQAAFAGDLHGFVVELIEHPARQPAAMAARLTELRERGAQIALDDVTTGYAGLLRMADLRPDIVKLDKQLVTGIRHRAEQVAVVEALVRVARSLRARVSAEGVESLSDLVTLSALGVHYVQGWAIGRPAPTLSPVSDEVVAACLAARRELLSLGPAPIAPMSSEAGQLALMYSLWTAVTAAAVGDPNEPLDFGSSLDGPRQLAGIAGASVSALDEKGNFVVVGRSGIVGETARGPLSQYPALVAAMRERLILEAGTDHPGSDPTELALLQARGMMSALIVPMVFEDRVVGIFELFERRPRIWSAAMITVARGSAAQMAVAIGHRQKGRS